MRSVTEVGPGSLAQNSGTSSMKRKLMAVQVRTADLGRRLDSAQDVELQKSLGCTIKEDWQQCFEAVSLLHADILSWDTAAEDLEKLACWVEDVLFEVNERLSIRIRNLTPKKGLRNPRVGTDDEMIADLRDLNIPVDSGLAEKGTRSEKAVKVTEEPGPSKLKKVTTNTSISCNREESFSLGSRMQPKVVPKLASMSQAWETDLGRPRVCGVELNPEARPFFGRRWNLYEFPIESGQFLPPAPHLKLESYDGDLLKYWDFKRRFKRHVEDVYPSSHDRMAFLDSLCVGKAHDVIAGIGCMIDSQEAYVKAWDRLDKRFGDERKIMDRLRKSC